MTKNAGPVAGGTRPRRRLAPKRLKRLVEKEFGVQVARALEKRPPYVVNGPVTIGHEVAGWRTATWAGANQVGSSTVIDQDVTVGFGTRIGSGSLLAGPLEIGRYGSIGAHVGLLGSTSHPIHTAATYTSPTIFRGRRKELVQHQPMSVGNDVWIGHGATLLGSIRVGDGAVVGAGSVVTNDVEPFEIVVGSPARRIRYRFDSAVCDLLLAFSWWELSPDELAVFEEVLAIDLTADVDRACRALEEAIEKKQQLVSN